ncbi:MAG TPA: chaplin family protein [Actinoplanes sp.]|jgi:hypothetical protein
MKTWVRKTLSVGVLAAGALLFAPGAAHADAHQSNGDNNGILNGTQLVTGVQVPVNIVGNSVGILGEANSFGTGVNRVEGTHVGQFNGDNNGIANGTQAYLPISVPLNIAGNSVAALGEANSAAAAVNEVHSRRAESGHTTEGGWGGNGGGQFNGDNNGILNGTQIYAPISVPINACGNSIALLGGAYSQALCGNDVFGGTRFHRVRRESGKVTESAWQSNGDNNGILNGTQLYAPISLPVNLSGNSVAVLGEANSRAVSGNRIESAQGGWGNQSNGDNNGILNGTQIAAPISIPINVCGNSLGLLGSAGSAAACGNDVFGGDDIWIDDNGHRHHGGHGVLGGDNGHKGGHNGNGHGQNAGDNGDKGDPGQYAGDNGTKPATNGYGDDNGTEPATGGYGNGTEPATSGYGNGTKPATAGYQGTKDDNSKYGDKATRGKSKSTEASPVSSLTDTVGGMGDSSGLGGLGLLNTLR